MDDARLQGCLGLADSLERVFADHTAAKVIRELVAEVRRQNAEIESLRFQVADAEGAANSNSGS